MVLAFTADEEAGGTWGARWLVDNHPGLFEGVTEAVGEVGGFSLTLGRQRLYLLQTAEKGLAWMRLTARGTAGHGSMIQRDNAVTELAEAIGRLGRHEWPVRLLPSVQAFLEGAAEALGVEFMPNDPELSLGKLGTISRIIGATLRNTANPTVLSAGYKVNVVPQTATAEVDGRFLPGYEQEFYAELDRVLGPGVTREFIHGDIAVETTPDGALYEAMTSALIAEDPPGAGDSVLPVRGYRCEVVQSARHAVLRFHAASAAAGPGLSRHVPRYRRAGARRCPALRRPRPGPFPRLLLAAGPRRADGSGASPHRCRPDRGSCYFFPFLPFLLFLLFLAMRITPLPGSCRSTIC